MRLYLNGNYTRVVKVVGKEDVFELIIESGNGEHTFVELSGIGLEKLFAQIDYALKEAEE